MSSASRNAAGPDSLDVLMMQTEICKRYGGEVLYGVSGLTGKGSALQFTALWYAPLVGSSGTGTTGATDIRVACALPAGRDYNLWAYAYRLLWELSAAIGEALGDDAEWL